MKDLHDNTALTPAQRSAIRAGAQAFARKHDLTQDLADLEWQALATMKADTRRATRDLVKDLTDRTPEEMAAAIEAAQDALLALLDMIEGEMDARSARGNRGPSSAIDIRRRPKLGDDDDASTAYALQPEQRMSTWATARSVGSDQISAGAFLRALTVGARNEAEQRALSGGTDAAGGFTVPTTTSAELIDLARSQMVLNQAGARIVPLTTAETVFAKVASDPVPAWRAENAAVNESDPTFASVVLQPKSIAVMVKASVELMSDSINLEAELPNVLARALAVEIDRAGLIGSGTGNQPRGIANFAGLTANAFAGGALESYGPLLQARGALHGANERLTAFVMSSRDENTFAGLTASDGQPLQMPRALEGVQMLHTTSLPTNGGVGEDESTIIAGDFGQLLIGVRSDIRVEILRERFMDNLQFGLICHARIDFAAGREGAFTKLTGITG